MLVSFQKDFSDDCIFNEAMELHHYNTYSSAKHSNSRRILYLALNRHGQTRKIHIPITRSLGKLSTYTNALTHPVDETVTQALLAKLFGQNHVRHGLKQLCDSPKVHLRPLTSPLLIVRPKCLVNDKVAGVKKAAAAYLPSPKVLKGGKKKVPGSGKKCKGGEDPDGNDCVRPTPMQVLMRKKVPPQKHHVKCVGGEENCSQSPKKSPKRRPNNAAVAITNAAGKPNASGKRKRIMGGVSGRTTTLPTTTTEQDQGDLDTDEEGGASDVDDPALGDDPTLYHHHHLYINRLSSSLHADEEDADFD